MALVDVSLLLCDPDLADDIIVIRSIRTVDSTGRTQDSPAIYPTFGNVQQATDRDLQQLSDMERSGSLIVVTTPFKLVPLTDDNAPDQISWQGKTYRVVSAGDWSFYGNGYTRATCQLEQLTNDGGT